jgi:hypothetical protein
MIVRFDPTSPLAYSGCFQCSEYREEALLSYAVQGGRQCLNCSTSLKKWKRWGNCVGCSGENLPLERDHVLGRKYQPEILEPLCRNCHRVKTVLTDHLPNDGDMANFKLRAEGKPACRSESRSARNERTHGDSRQATKELPAVNCVILLASNECPRSER